MAAKAVAIEQLSEPVNGVGEDLFMIAMPGAAYRAISDQAMKRGMTFAQALSQALDQWAAKGATPQPVEPNRK